VKRLIADAELEATMPNADALASRIGRALRQRVAQWLMTYAIHSTILIGGLLVLTSQRRTKARFGARVMDLAVRACWRGHHVVAQSVRSAPPLTEHCVWIATRLPGRWFGLKLGTPTTSQA
jgi:hypothetical protein